MKIITEHINPPIPIRGFDWSAITDSYDGQGSPIGRGKTELEAIKDLVLQLEDLEEENVKTISNF